jgi:hypothetical protein
MRRDIIGASMPPIGISDNDLPKSGPQLSLILALGGLLIGFSVIATVIITKAVSKNADCESLAPAAPVVGRDASGIPMEVVDLKAYVAAFESGMKIKKVENNLFTLERDETALDIRNNEDTELRTYISWDRPEGMEPNQIVAKIHFVRIEKGEEPIVTNVQTIMHETEMFIVDGATLMYDPANDGGVLFTFDATKFWADQHTGIGGS